MTSKEVFICVMKLFCIFLGGIKFGLADAIHTDTKPIVSRFSQAGLADNGFVFCNLLTFLITFSCSAMSGERCKTVKIERVKLRIVEKEILRASIAEHSPLSEVCC